MKQPAVAAVVLAGGRSRRLGMDKTTMPWPPPPLGQAGPANVPSLLSVVAGHLAAICSEVILVNYRGAIPLPYRTVPDAYPDSGSLGGIYSGLAAASDGWAFAVAADMPFLNGALIRHMLALPREWDALVPRIGGRPEPLHALYGPACLPAMRRRIEARQLKIAGFFEDVQVRFLEEAEVRRFDPDLRSFFNINTPADLEQAQVLFERTHRPGPRPSPAPTRNGGDTRSPPHVERGRG